MADRKTAFFRVINSRFKQILNRFLQVFDGFLSVFDWFYIKIMWNLFPVDSFFDQINPFTVHACSKNEQKSAISFELCRALAQRV
jgi:hypothetical protein